MKSKIVALCVVFVLLYGVVVAGIEKKGPEQITHYLYLLNVVNVNFYSCP